MKFVPRPYQEKIVDLIVAHDRLAIWAGMGLGKTVCTLTALDALSLVQEGPALVLAPLRVAKTTWPEERHKWDHLRHADVVPIVGTPSARVKALARKAPVYTMNYDNLPWLVDYLGGEWPFTTIVADESTRLKAFRLQQGGSRARALAKRAWSKTRRFIELTGTPSPNGLADLWGQIWFLDKGERLGKSFSAFADRWFQKAPTASGFFFLRPLPHAQKEIEEKLADICFTFDARDYFDVRAPLNHRISVDLPPAARRAYKDMEKTMFAEIYGYDIEAAAAAGRTVKCLQIANGAAYTDDAGAWVEVHREKIEALREIVEEAAGAPVMVAYHFKSDLARIQKAFPQARVLDKDPKTIADWNAGRIEVLLAHPASAGHGLSLQDGGNIIAFFGHWWDLEQRQQIIERIGPVRQMQAGHDRPVFVYDIVASRTVDELVLERHRTKRSVQDTLLDAMKRAA